MAIDDTTQLANVVVLTYETQATKMGLVLWFVVLFDGKRSTCWRVLSHNGSASSSRLRREASSALGLTPKRTRSYIRQTNGNTSESLRYFRRSGIIQ